MPLFKSTVATKGGADNVLKKKSIQRIFYVLFCFYLSIFVVVGYIISTSLSEISEKIGVLAMAQESLTRRAQLMGAIDKLIINEVVLIPASRNKTSSTDILDIISKCYDCHHKTHIISTIRGLEEGVRHYREIRRTGQSSPQMYSEAVMPLALKTVRFAEDAFEKAVVFSKRSADQMAGKLFEIKRVWLIGMVSGLGLFLIFSVVSLRRVSRLQADAENEHSKVVQSEKMAALGRMLAGAAHELNNPLTAILGYSALLRNATLDDTARQTLDTINKAAERMARIIQNLLTYSRVPKLEIRPVLIKDFIMESAEYALAAAHATGLKLSIDAAPDLIAYMDRPHMEQVLANLIINSAQAIKESGIGDCIMLKAWVDNNKFYLSVSDNGPGIADEIKENIFEPFFTTKRPGKGTGLGLSICHTIVKAHNGTIRFDSTKNKGTTFVVELPRVPERPNHSAHNL